MRFRAGFRRVNLSTPTEYQLQYSWKTPVEDSPLLNAENMLYRSSHPTKVSTEQAATNGTRDDQSHSSDLGVRGQLNGRQSGHSRSKRKHGLREVERTNAERREIDQMVEELQRGEREVKEIDRDVEEVEKGHGVGGQSLNLRGSSPKSSKKKQRKDHRRSPKKKSGHRKHKEKSLPEFVTEYSVQYKPWPVQPKTDVGKRNGEWELVFVVQRSFLMLIDTESTCTCTYM